MKFWRIVIRKIFLREKNKKRIMKILRIADHYQMKEVSEIL